MKVVIPMSGQSSRFTSAGYSTPKHLIEIDGKKVIEHIVELYPKGSEFVFIINDKHKEETDIVKVLGIGVADIKRTSQLSPPLSDKSFLCLLG